MRNRITRLLRRCLPAHSHPGEANGKGGKKVRLISIKWQRRTAPMDGLALPVLPDGCMRRQQKEKPPCQDIEREKPCKSRLYIAALPETVKIELRCGQSWREGCSGRAFITERPRAKETEIFMRVTKTPLRRDDLLEAGRPKPCYIDRRRIVAKWAERTKNGSLRWKQEEMVVVEVKERFSNAATQPGT